MVSRIVLSGIASLVMASAGIGCSAHGGEGERGAGLGGEPGGTCNSAVSCEGCGTCFERCFCDTGNAELCATACGAPNPGSGDPGGGDPGGGDPGGGDPGGGDPGGGDPGGGDPGGGDPGGGDPGGQQCEYPTGNFGTEVGQVLNGSLGWTGFLNGSDAETQISVQDYFDCDGAKGITALLLITSATWCGACQQEAQQLNSVMTGAWGASGVKVLTLMIEDANSNPATVATAKQWKDYFSASGWSVVADPSFTFARNGSNALPMMVVVNPRTMQIVDRDGGYIGQYPAIQSLIQQNQ